MNTATRIAAIAAASLVLSTAFASAKTAISVGMQQEPTSLDPTSDATASIDGMLSHNVYESLTTVNEQGEVLPDLAKSWTISDDGLVYRFSLEQGVTYHDGTTFDAEDVKFALERAMGKDSVNPSKGFFSPIETVTVVDPSTVELKLKHADAFLLFNLASGDASIVAPESAESNKTKPVGTGPYRFDSWTRGDRLVLAKYPAHRSVANARIEEVSFRFIADAAAASAALMSEEIDAFPGFPAPELLPQFEADPRFTVQVGSTEGEVILAMNNSRAPFDDIRVRRAISHAIDRTAIIDGAMYGQAVPIGSFYPPHGKSYVDLTGTYPHDIAKAKALLKEARLAEGTTMTLRVPPFSYATRPAEIIQANLAEAGIDLKVENVEWGFWLDEMYNKLNYDMTIIAHTAPNDLGNFANGKSYFYGYENPEYTALWNEIKTEADPVKRDELVKRAQKFLADEAVHGFLFQLPSIGINRREISGFWTSAPVQFQPLIDVKWTD